MEPQSQAETLALLASPATHGGVKPERLDTHISAVFLAGERVYKLKKAVHLPFVDFTSLAARQAACAAELAINGPAAPDLYFGVTAVTRGPDGALALGGGGDPVDYVVVMRRFDEECRFDRVVARGGADRRMVQDLTAAIIAFHRAAPVRRDRGGVAGLAWVIATNAAAMAPHVPIVLAADGVAELQRLSSEWLARLAPVLERRREAGRVRRCHGDLHLANICLFQGRPTLFDAIEFSDDIACVDVFYDLAFLLMDLDRHGERALASLVMNYALDLDGDYDAVAALPLFLSLRAAVRAHVAAATAGPDHGEEARAALASALAYLTPAPPRLVAVGGLSGSGKSRLARDLAPLLAVPGAAVIRSDAVRKQIMGVGLTDRLGPEGYTADMTERTYARVLDIAAEILADGHAVIADAVFARPEQRAAMAAVAAAAKVPFHGFWLDVGSQAAAARVAIRTGDASDATPAVVEAQHAYDVGPITWTRLDSSGAKEDVTRSARHILGV